MLASVDKSVIGNFCEWLAQLCDNFECKSIALEECPGIETIPALQQWMESAAAYMEEKYFPCGTLGSDEFIMCIDDVINLGNSGA